MATSVSSMAKVVRVKASKFALPIKDLLYYAGVSYNSFKYWLKIESLGSDINRQKMQKILDFLSQYENLHKSTFSSDFAEVS